MSGIRAGLSSDIQSDSTESVHDLQLHFRHHHGMLMPVTRLSRQAIRRTVRAVRLVADGGNMVLSHTYY